MTSERAAIANRRNARASTGPLTEAGKARSGQNARRHGLAIRPAPFDTDPETENLAGLIAGDFGTDPAIRDAARMVAAAQLHLRQVLRVKHALVKESGLDPDIEAGSANASLAAAANGLARLERLERYARRAFSRRKFTIRQFEALVAQARRDCLRGATR